MKKIKKSIYEPLDDYERQLIQDLKNNEFVEVPNQEDEVKRYVSYFENMPKKDKRITIRVESNDLKIIQDKAIETGIPYQTLIASILRKFARGKITIGV